MVRPWQVTLAVSLLSTSVGESFLEIPASFNRSGENAIYSIGSVLLAAWLVLKIWQGKYWARNVLLTIMSIGAAMVTVLLLADHFAQANNFTPLGASIRLAHISLRSPAFALLYTRPGANWFPRPSSLKSTSR